LRFAVMWLIATWLLGVPLVLAAGGIGYALANAGVLATNFLLFGIARSRLRFRVLPATAPVWLCALAVGVGVHLAATVRPPRDLVELAAYLAAGGVVYLLAFAALAPRELRQVWAWARGKASRHQT
jgi:hypothetical protein